MTAIEHVVPTTGEITTQPRRASTDLAKLATRLPDHLVEKNPKGKDYAAHEVITQWLLYVVGPFSFELVQIHRGDVREREGGKFTDDSKVLLSDVVVGATFRLTCLIDGRTATIEQTGDVEQPTNWQHDGARIKDAESDAIKRAAMRVGAALHLWAKDPKGADLYFLDKWLAKRATADPIQPQVSSGPDPTERSAVQDAATNGTAGRPAGKRAGGGAVANANGPRDSSPAASHPAGPDDPTTGDADAPPARVTGSNSHGHSSAAVTVADLKALCDRKGTHMGMLLNRVRKAARDGEGGFPRTWGKSGRDGLTSFDQLAPDALAKVLAWADPDRELVDALAADTPHGEGGDPT